ncbi:MAG TPA: M20/M25/M40 family metallo-hydrolase, partial [Chloroflexia bacterium]|nr:M20/M25/M40 family metallo-hydrolase [Chloroflexia bacterium]
VSLPTASFHEEKVCAAVVAFLKEYKIPFEIDRYGNIIAHYQKGPSLKHPLALMAHTDHPAFELTSAESSAEFPAANWTAKLLGGVGMDWLKQEMRVKVFPGNDITRPVEGKMVGAKALNGPRNIQLFMQFSESAGLEPGNFGIWNLTDFELRDGFIHARVMDDLVGVTAAMLALWKVSQEGTETDLYAVFTRAEEVGLVGAELVFQQKLLPAGTYVVSLEASRTLPGAVQGEGPVVRVGDRSFTFSEEAEFALKIAAKTLTAQGAKIQRQLMSGGRCEASTAILQGYISTGLAFPLGNYHNMADDFSLQAENIHQDDFITGVELLQEAARLSPRLAISKAEQLAAESTPQELVDRLLGSRANFNLG